MFKWSIPSVRDAMSNVFQISVRWTKYNSWLGTHFTGEQWQKTNYNKTRIRFGSICNTPRSSEEESSKAAWDCQGQSMNQITLDLGSGEWTGVNWVEASASHTMVTKPRLKRMTAWMSRVAKGQGIWKKLQRWGLGQKKACTPSQGIRASSWRQSGTTESF